MFPVSSNGTSTFYKGHLEGDNVVIEGKLPEIVVSNTEVYKNKKMYAYKH